jgi:hypothetical protein
MSIAARRATCGIRVVASSLSSTREAAAEACEALYGDIYQHIVTFFSASHDADVLVGAIGKAFPETAVSGCSTAGEVGPLGMMQGGVVLIAFPERGFRIFSQVIPSVEDSGVERASEIAHRMKIQMIAGASREVKDNIFALLLMDGLSNDEEALIAAINMSLHDIDMLGGSAGDSLAFRNTVLIHHGQRITGSAILFMIESEAPFAIFKTQNFEATPIKLVVTAADVENRIVHELNAEPASREYAAAIGLPATELGPFSFASYPLVVKIGGDYYCRSIRNINPDGSMSFFCAIDEGLVFTVARPKDIVQSTKEVLEKIDTKLGGVDLVLGFDCILRRLDAESRQVRHRVDELYQSYGVAGFHTYGEQFNGMHLNQTLTGIAFGRGVVASEDAL